jgi:hypothetical protein
MVDEPIILDTPCPQCGMPLRLEWRLTTKPIGTWSLAGRHMKFPVHEVPWIICDTCGISAQGTRDDGRDPGGGPDRPDESEEDSR